MKCVKPSLESREIAFSSSPPGLLVLGEIEVCLSQQEMLVSGVAADTQHLVEGLLGFLSPFQFAVADTQREKEIRVVLLSARQGFENLHGMLGIVLEEVAHPQEIASLVIVRLGLEYVREFRDGLGTFQSVGIDQAQIQIDPGVLGFNFLASRNTRMAESYFSVRMYTTPRLVRVVAEWGSSRTTS
ncbi:MAG: hypothetical protein ABSF71_37345 [Terriglobia bacterium]